MENNVDALNAIGQNRLEQVSVNMPQVRFYFSGDRAQTEENLTAYLGEEQLKLQSLQQFDEGDGSMYYYVLLDVSASISNAEFSEITEALSEFCKTVRPQDQVAFITFGEEVRTLFTLDGEALNENQAGELIQGLENNDQRTLLFEAVHQMSELSKSISSEESTRRVAYVITDGADIATGKATKEEALNTLQQSGIPVYGFTVESAGRESVNGFGEFSRTTGGYLTILEKGDAFSGFASVREEILGSYEAVFEASSNRVSHELTGAVLEFVSEGEKQQMQVLQDRWIKDTEAPVVTEIVSEGQSQLRVVFSEPVSGADAAENFRLETEAESYLPAFASPGSDGTSTVLSFSETLKNGSYELVCSNIKDRSMEENLLEESACVEIEGNPSTEESSNVWKDYGWMAVLVILVLFIGAAFAGWRRLKKRKAIVTVDGKAVLSSNTEVRQHVLVEKKKLEEKNVYFHVLGQKEKIPVTIKKSMIVGRSSACELIFDDPALSRQHFALELKEGRIYIQNLSRSGFTQVNGSRLGGQSYELHSGDEIHAGQLKMTIRW